MENHHAPTFTPGWNDPPSNVAPTVSGINKLQRHKRLVDPSITGYGGNPMTNNFSPYQQQQSPQFNQPQNPQFNQPQNPHLGQSLNSQVTNQQSQQSFFAPAPQFGQQNPANLGQLSPGQTSNFSPTTAISI
ncbi:hypothetical protein M3Y97_00801700 [Aphelenchoides bicaudatus]|nr:hypothetical protein M3Y97_00801700 [Aphelenchoides bicaudatus]